MLSPEERARLLRYNVLLSRAGDEPLHAQLTRSLRNLIMRHFEVDERFYPEEELGEKLGLSIGTVRRSLNRLVDEGLLRRSRGKGSFVCRTGGTESGGLHVIAVVNTLDSFFTVLLLRELSYLCQHRGHSLDVMNPGQDERVARVLDVAIGAAPGTAFVFLALEPDFTHDLVRATQARGVPSVNIDTWLTGYPGVQVAVDNRRGIELGLDHLAELGHRRIALLLSEYVGHENVRARIEAFHAGIASRNFEGIEIESSPLPHFEDLSAELRFRTEARYDARIDARVADRVLESKASAVFCVSDIGANFLMKRLHMAGVRIPEDISVMGFNDEGSCQMVYPELTTIAQPYAEIATHALDALAQFEDSARHIRLEPRLVVRDSTGALPSRRAT